MAFRQNYSLMSSGYLNTVLIERNDGSTMVVQKVLGLDQTHFRGRLYFPLVFNIAPFARLCQGPTFLEHVDARAEELFFQSFKPQHYSSLQILIVSKALSPEVFLQAREHPEVAWGEIWAIGWVIQFAEAAFLTASCAT